MQSIDYDIGSLCYQIKLEKSKIESAISRGEVFENVKKIVVNLRELEKKLEDLISRQTQPAIDYELKLGSVEDAN